MQAQFFCLICSQQYRDNNLPRILTMCGHTYCQICISKMITENISEQQAEKGHPFLIVCPQDGAEMKLTVNQLKSFPKNLALIKVLESKKQSSSFKDESFDLSKIVKQQQIQWDDQTTDLISVINQCKQNRNQDNQTQPTIDSIRLQHAKCQSKCLRQAETKKQITICPEKQEDEMCLLHQKPLQIICIIDRQKICSKCAIFGQHKGHDFRSIQEVEKQRNTCYNDILQIFKEKSDIEQRMSNQQTQSGLIQILNKKKENLEKQVREEYRKLREAITKQQKVVLRTLNDTCKNTQTKIKSLLKVDQIKLKDFNSWQKQSYDLLKILQSTDLEPKVDVLYSKQLKNKKILNRGKSILSQIKQQEAKLVGRVQQILVDLQSRKNKTIFQCISEFVTITNMPDKPVELKNSNNNPNPRNMAVSTLIIENSQNLCKQKTSNSNCSIFDAFNQKNNILEGSPLLEESLLDIQENPNIGRKSFEDLQSNIKTFSHDFEIRLPLQPRQNLMNKNIQEDSISCSFTNLQLQSARKMPQKTAFKHKYEQESDIFTNQRSSILTSRPSMLNKKQNGQKPTKKKLKSIKVSQKYQKMLEGIYNNSVDTIDLTNAQVGDQIMLQICEFIKHSKARTIKFIRNKLTDMGVQKLLPSLGNAQILNLSQNNLTQAVLDVFIKHRNGYLSGVKNIILSQNKIIERKHKGKIDQLRAMNLVVSV